ncbi:MAG TPA: ABC transporter permease [Candidatus Angelobacter sp.]|nr:ABC transporter permease [Candidatus Angelobacter sp.]
MGTLFQDVRYGFRMLLKSPATTLVAVLTLALGIGANTTIFSTVNGLLLRPLPVANADRLVVFVGKQQGGDDFVHFAYADYKDIRSQADGFSEVMAYTLTLAGMEYQGRTEPIVLSYVSGNFFSGLGLKPAEGRLIYGEETERPSTENVVVLGYGYWKKRFNADPTIIGQQVKMNGHPVTVVGVTPESFHGTYSIVDMQAYVPLGMRTLWQIRGKDENPGDYWAKRDIHDLTLLAVPQPGLTRKQAEVSANVVAQRLNLQYPETHKGVSYHLYSEKTSRPDPDPSNGTVVVATIFMSLAGLVLLLACLNVANIVLVRATGRERELAIRTALGAARMRIVRQLLTESLLLGAAGGVLGLLAGIWTSRLISSVHIEIATIPIRFDFSFDWRVFTFGFAIALLTGLLVGLAPAWRAARSDFNQVLHEGSRGVMGSGRARLRTGIAGAQVALSLMLLVVAGLFIRSTLNTEHSYLGFDPHNVLNATMETRTVGFDVERSKQFYRELEDQARRLPGVESAAIAASVPMGYSNQGRPFYLEGQSAASKEAVPYVPYNVVDAPYFTTMRIPLLRGRTLTEQDTDKTPLVAVINEAMAKKFWPNQDPLGKRFSSREASGPFIEVVGLVKQGKYNDPTDDTVPFYYVPQAQAPTTFVTLQLRTSVDPKTLAPEVERLIHDMAPSLPVTDVQTMEEALGGVNGFFLMRMGTRFTTALGLLGLVLAIVGVYGVISYAAAQRTHEIGVRMALGASRSDIMKMVLRQGFVLVGIGVIAGLALTVVAGRGISSLLVGVKPTDPLTLGVVAVLLAIVGLVASLIPARRAMKIEPLRALKYE